MQVVGGGSQVLSVANSGGRKQGPYFATGRFMLRGAIVVYVLHEMYI